MRFGRLIIFFLRLLFSLCLLFLLVYEFWGQVRVVFQPANGPVAIFWPALEV